MIDFSKYGIDVSRCRKTGQGKVWCPQCSHGHGRSDTPLSVNFENGLFNCHRCGWAGCAAENGNETHWSDKIKPQPTRQKETPRPQPSFIESETFKKTLQRYEHNNFAQWLCGVVGQEPAMEAIRKYNVGSSMYCGNAAAYWYSDIQGNIRSAKVIPYRSDGHRRKDTKPKPEATWAHSYYCLNIPNFHFVRCLYGEHLLTDTSKTVALVEAEKSAVIASIYMPDFIWVSCGGAEGLNVDVCAILRGRNVIFFPDCGKHKEWSDKAAELSKTCFFSYSVSEHVEKNATADERAAGIDIADILTRFSALEFINQQPDNPTEVSTEPKTCPSNPVVASMVAKNPALLRLIETFDCEVTRTDRIEPQPSRLLTSDELTRLAAGLPDYNSWSESELCRLLNIEPKQVRGMIDRKQIYHIELTGKYCRSGCTPF